ncbi:MAG: UDP-N-acetylmuramate--L-alanine ligase [Elusimicrobiota bacterium]
MFEKIKKIHFIGIGGSGMCGIAEVLINMGYNVCGSDMQESENVRRLRKLGAVVNIGHRLENLDDPHVVVVSSAIDRNNSEITGALERKIPVIPRAEMLTELMRLKYALCIAGTHGKTTTTSMTGLILYNAGMDPTVVIGGRFNNLETNAKLGGGDYIVAEADESDGSFLHFTPAISIVTNIDDDHMDYYSNMDKLKNTFTEFLNKVPFYGFSVICGDDENLRSILPLLNRPYRTYGLGEKCDYRASDISLGPERSVYKVIKEGREVGEIAVMCSGMHNVTNSLAACATALEMGIDFKVISDALLQYRGVGRRLEKMGEAGGVIFYDDYAHHPTEIALSMKSLKEIYPDSRLIAVFQPHRYTRTRNLSKKFPGSLSIADYIYITDIYPAGEIAIEGVSSMSIIDEFEDKSKVKYIPDICELTDNVNSFLRPGDICVTLGAGDIYKILESLLKRRNVTAVKPDRDE